MYEEGDGTMLIRNKLLLNDEGKPEVWTNLGDVLDWLQTLPEHAGSPIAAGAAIEIKGMLLEQFTDADIASEDVRND
jgi:hypothetical protein